MKVIEVWKISVNKFGHPNSKAITQGCLADGKCYVTCQRLAIGEKWH